MGEIDSILFSVGFEVVGLNVGIRVGSDKLGGVVGVVGEIDGILFIVGDLIGEVVSGLPVGDGIGLPLQ